jgi:pimeloyl-ACP methyl ester carboxylesterase
MMDRLPGFDRAVLPADLRSRFVDGVNGLRMHILEAGFAGSGRPLALLLHGFPELAYSWRKIMPALAAAGFHAVAPDLRGYGRTTGCDTSYDADLSPFRMMNLVGDMVALVAALGHRDAAGVVGHDFGSPVAAWCSLVRPDLFRSVTLMSAPFAGPPAAPFDTTHHPPPAPAPDIDEALAALDPPRKHYQWYYATRPANGDMCDCPQGIHDFLRGYYHVKSAGWDGNRPFPLAGWRADELAKMPTYYIMARDRNMAETAAATMPSPAEIAACRWLTEPELAVYSGEYRRTGFQGGLQWYRVSTGGRFNGEALAFSGRTIDVPALFIAGASDWGVYQRPGAFARMQGGACTRMEGCHLVPGAGHWVQQEQPEAVTALLLPFLQRRLRQPVQR